MLALTDACVRNDTFESFWVGQSAGLPVQQKYIGMLWTTTTESLARIAALVMYRIWL